MSIKSRKLFAILVIAMMVMTLLPAVAFATSDNTVDKVPQVASDHIFTAITAPNLRIVEKNVGEFTTETFRLTLENAEWNVTGAVLTANSTATPAGSTIAITVLSDTVAEVVVTGAGAGTNKATFLIPLITEIVAEGEAKVTIDSRDSKVSSTTFVFANSAPGKTIARVSSVNSFSRRGNLGTIEVDETRIGALGIAAQNLRIKLPPKFSWDLPAGWGTAADIVFSGGLAATFVPSTTGLITGDGTRTLEINFTPGTNTVGVVDRGARGSIFLNNLRILAERDATDGDVVADFDGTNITGQELVVAKHMDYVIQASIPEVKEIVAGSYDNRTAKITIEELLPSAMISNREISVVLPEWVKIANVRNVNATQGLTAGDLVFPTNKHNEIYFIVNAGVNPAQKSKYEFVLDLSVEADKKGDIVAEIFGAGMEKQELTIATAVPPVTVEIKPTDVKIGVQNQPAPDILITETAKARIDNDLPVYDGVTPIASLWAAAGFANELTVTLPAGFQFSSPPTVEVEDGNLELGPLGFTPGALTLRVNSSSTRPSTIRISNIKLTLDRTVPEGNFNIDVGGGSIVKNHNVNATNSRAIVFNKARVVRELFGKVITPAPGEVRATSVFSIGSTNYTVMEDNVSIEKTMDVAPYLKDGRTFLPLRYVANALDVDDDNIVWDPVSRAVTIFKGDRIAQVTIDDKTMLVNGVTINMDVAPEITDGRTMLPIRWMGQALGANIDWDPEARSVTVKQ